MAGRFFLLAFFRVFYSVFFLALGFPTISFSAESKPYPSLSHPKKEGQIPESPTAPPPLTQRVPVDVPHCERYFLYKGKNIECDSETGKDALRLNLLMRDLPYALSELDIYRENQRKIRIAGFAGTVGILAAIAGVMVSHPILDPVSGSIRRGGFISLAGLAITANSLIYGLSMMKANEVHVANAVQYYNSVHPEQPIELEFSTHIDF